MMDRMLSLIRRHPSPADLSARADGMLAGAARQRVEGHLERCPRCRERLQELVAVRSLLGDLPAVTAPRSFRLSPAAVRGPERTVRRGYPVLQLASAVAAVAFLLLVGGDLATSVGLPGGGGGESPRGRTLQSAQPGPATSTGFYAGIAGTPEKSAAGAPASAGEAAPSPPPAADRALAPPVPAPGTPAPEAQANAPEPGTAQAATPAYAYQAPQPEAAATPQPALEGAAAAPPAAEATPADQAQKSFAGQNATPAQPAAAAPSQAPGSGPLAAVSPTATSSPVEPQTSHERLDKGRTALRAAEALVGLVALAGVTGTVLRRRRTG